ncbi:MAG: nodulation protein NfeD [Campylobacterota bacterium]|nr:nodulation protein NfeD [Campylobacterota bacterium]
MKCLMILLSFITYIFAEVSTITHIRIDGPVSPATSHYLKNALNESSTNGSYAILIELDTPGGVSSAMRDMIKDILNSPIPVITYVSPKGARAASAGTYLLYASHIAAMAPGTNLGAATPVNIMQPQTKESNNTAISSLEKKIVNDSAAYIKSLAQLRDRNVSWALKAVEEAKSLSSTDALKLNVIDTVSQNITELMKQIDGKSVKVKEKDIVLKTKEHRIVYFEAGLKTKILMIVSDPNIAYLLIMAAIYGIFFELMNPGAIFPGIIGVISGILALYAFNVLPFNYAGLILLIFGILLMSAEVFVAGFGILGIGGVVAFGFGSFFLFDEKLLGSGVSLPLIIAICITSLLFFLLVIRYLLKARKAKIVSGKDEMVGMEARIIKITKDGYLARCHGEIWNAVSDSKIKKGETAVVDRISDLVLKLKPKKE